MPRIFSWLRRTVAFDVAELDLLRRLAMVKTASTMRQLGTPAPDFHLLNVDGRMVGLDDFRDQPGLLVMFMCNHCPFVKHVADGLTKLANDYLPLGVAIVGINSNDAAGYPQDSPEQMVHEANERGYPFPYLYDETQEVAKAYGAACTPDFFVFDKSRRLFYRGQLDASRPGNNIPVTGADLRASLDAMLAGEGPPEKQIPSIGCNIKWRAGNEPQYFEAAGMK
jgi:peroxiredoxin